MTKVSLAALRGCEKQAFHFQNVSVRFAALVLDLLEMGLVPEGRRDEARRLIDLADVEGAAFRPLERPEVAALADALGMALDRAGDDGAGGLFISAADAENILPAFEAYLETVFEAYLEPVHGRR